MSQEFHAIFEHGVFRPLVPVSLPESTEFVVSIHDHQPSESAQLADPLLGFMSNEPELLDAIVEEAMNDRESLPLRTTE